MSFRRAQTASQWERNLYPVQSNQIKIISCIEKRKDWKWDGERGTEVLQKGSPEIAAIPGQILYKSACPKSLGGFCSFLKNIRSDIFLFPSLFLHCSIWLGFSAFLSDPIQLSRIRFYSSFTILNQLGRFCVWFSLAGQCESLHGNSILWSHFLSLMWF